MDLIELLRHHDIPHTTEHHHATRGSVQVHCPFCGDAGFHLGIRLDGKVAHCWRCGGHNGAAVLAALLRRPYREIEQLLSGIPATKIPKRKTSAEGDGEILPVSLPIGTGPMQDRHKQYLRRRGFDPDALESEYGLQGTGPLGSCKHRIVIPIVRQGTTISYTARDITGKAAARYKTCPGDIETHPAKQWLYHLDRRIGADRILVVEGPTDVWRMGPGTVATMGISWTWAQAELLSKFARVFVLFDPEERAQRQAQSLVDALRFLSVEAEIADPVGGAEDPGSMTEGQVKSLRKWLGL
jgi:DNA primase